MQQIYDIFVANYNENYLLQIYDVFVANISYISNKNEQF